MSSICLPPQPRRVLFCHNSQLNRHAIWTQDFSRSKGGWLTPEAHDASTAVSSNPRHRGTPSASITSWAFSHPINNHFIFVTHLTVSNYDNISMQDVLKVLGSVPRLQELELCRVNIIDSTTGPFARPANMIRSLKRLAIEACNITEGYLDGYYDLLFRFLALFEHVERLRLAATIFRDEDACFHPAFYYLRLPTIVHLEAEGFFSYVLLCFFQQGYPVQGLRSLHLSRCFGAWQKIFRLEQIVRIVSPTLQHFAFRPNLEANSSGGVRGLGTHFRDFAQAFRQCTELRELEFGLYTYNEGRGLSHGMSLLRPILEALPSSRLTHLAFVLDIGDSSVSPDRVVPWETLDAQLSRVCVSGDGQWPLQVRIARYVPALRSGDHRVDYEDQRLWYRRLPTMQHRMGVHDTVRGEQLTVGQYGAPMGIDVGRNARLLGPGLRSLFDQ